MSSRFSPSRAHRVDLWLGHALKSQKSGPERNNGTPGIFDYHNSFTLYV